MYGSLKMRSPGGSGMPQAIAGKVAVLSFVPMLGLSTAGVQAEPAEPGQNTAHDSGHHGEGGHHKNVLGLFVGVTHEGRGDNEAAVGIEYERRISSRNATKLSALDSRSLGLPL